jgi:hypothetical protein
MITAMRARYLSGIASLLLVLGVVHRADAQSAEAEALFREGKKLVKAGKVAEGCDKLEASERLESSTGTLLNLGDCREKNGQLASAWAAFAKAATSAKRESDAKREGEARRRAALLDPKLAKLTIAVPKRIDGLVIKRNDQPVDPALWNTEIPVDAGMYKVSATAPGFNSYTGTIAAVDGKKAVFDVTLTKPGEVKPVPVKTELTPDPVKVPIKATPTEEPDGDGEQVDAPAGPGTFTTLRKASIGVAVIGVGGIVLGAVYGGKAKDLQKQADAICPMPACGDPHAVDLNHQAKDKATLANVGFVVGGAAIVGAVALWFVGAPKAESHAVAIVPTPDGVSFTLAGRF